MKSFYRTGSCAALVLVTGLALVTLVRGQDGGRKGVPPGLENGLKRYFSQKEELARTMSQRAGKVQDPEVWNFFEAAKKSDWESVDDAYATLRSIASQRTRGKTDHQLLTTVWQAINESYCAYDEMHHGDERYVTFFGQEILKSIPAGSIYFGGTDPGRWLVSAFCKSHNEGDPCFVLTQNALADASYLGYLHELYGKRINLPSTEDCGKIFGNYVEDARKRMAAGLLKPGENVFENEDGRVQVSGQVAVTQLNALIAMKIFEMNPERQFFIEESFPLEWMYPHLAPNGLIMKLERKPILKLLPAAIEVDRTYWTAFVDRALGKWLKPETSTHDLCEFATKTFTENNEESFHGDLRFLKNKSAQRTFSKLRTALGGMYAWRARNSETKAEKERMNQEADLAFRQSFAICPYNPETVFRYTALLIELGRKKEALLLAETAEDIAPGDSGINRLVSQLQEPK